MTSGDPPLLTEPSDLRTPSARSDFLFEEAFKIILLTGLYGDITRCKNPAKVACGTLYNLFLEKNKAAFTNDGCEEKESSLL